MIIEEKLSQFEVDPLREEDYKISVSANWLKQLLRDYRKTINSLKDTQTTNKKLQARVDYLSNKSDEVIVELNVLA